MSVGVRLPVKRMANCTLGKMVQTEQRGPADELAPYLRAAHVQPSGRLVELDEQPMWFSPAERDALDLQRDDVVVVEGGAGYGRSAVLPRPLPGWGFQNSIIRVRPQHGRSEGRFIDYAIQSALMSGEIEILCNTATIPHFTAEKVASLRVPAPTLDEQRAIADFLDEQTSRVDTLISKQACLIELLRERRAAVVSAAFEPGPSTEATKVGRLLAVRPSYGVLVPTYVNEADGAPFIRVGDLLNLVPGRPLLAIAPEQSDEYSRTKIVGGEVLLGVVGKMGQAALAPQWLAGANVARAVAVLRCKEPDTAPILCAWLGSANFRHQAALATSGDSIQPTLGMKDLARFDINLPTGVDAGADLLRKTSKIDALISKAQDHIALTKERRSALITAAVTGQIDVRTAGRAASVEA